MRSERRRFRRVCVVTGDHQMPDATKPEGHYSADDLRYHAAMRAALEGLPGYEFEFLTQHDRLLQRITHNPPEFVFNLCDTGFRNVASHELHVPALLELIGIPYSGAPPACMAICYDKAIVRMVADSLGVATPHELYLDPDQDSGVLEHARYPALIKPNCADGSVGITRDAVVKDPLDARAYLDRLRHELPGRAALVQEYLPGPEYGLALVGNTCCGLEALPALEVDYGALPDNLPPILAYESKTVPTSPYWRSIRYRRARLDSDDESTLADSARRLFDRLQCRDYARFDFRTGADGVIKLMEANPNPAWDPEAKLALMAGFAGRSYAELLAMLLEAAQTRLAALTP